jgi:DNA invertase Pin-like site-specific DNA recombinase
MKAALYARVSTADKQTNENQIPLLEQMAATRGWEVVAIYQDMVSAVKVGNDSRKQFPRMMEAARRGEFQILLTFGIDRLTRKGGIDAINIVHELSKYGVKVASYCQQWLDPTSPFYATMLAMCGDLAAMERNMFVERINAGLKRAAKHGTKSGKAIGRPKVVVDRQKIRQRNAAGESQSAIAADLGISVMTVNRIVRAA